MGMKMTGVRIREMRTARRMSLSEVAQKASISAATLSRIETGKQNINVELMQMIARVLHLSPHELLDDGEKVEGNGDGELASKVATLQPNDRARFWRDLSGSRKLTSSSRKLDDLRLEVDQLIACIDFLRGEVDRLRQGL